MNPPPKSKSALAKVTTVLAATLLICLGLCGVNSLVILATARSAAAGRFFIVTAYLEVIGLAVSFAGLLLVGLIAFAKKIASYFHHGTNKD